MKRETMDEVKAKKFLEDAEKKRLQRCIDKINKVLEEENCAIGVELHFTPTTGVQQGWVIISKN